MPPRRLALTLTALLVVAGAAPAAHAGDLSISVTTPTVGLSYARVHGHRVGRVHVVRPVVRRVAPPRRLVVRRVLVPPRPVRRAPAVVRRVVRPLQPVVAHVQPHGTVTVKTKHIIRRGKRTTKVITRRATVFRH